MIATQKKALECVYRLRSVVQKSRADKMRSELVSQWRSASHGAALQFVLGRLKGKLRSSFYQFREWRNFSETKEHQNLKKIGTFLNLLSRKLMIKVHIGLSKLRQAKSIQNHSRLLMLNKILPLDARHPALIKLINHKRVRSAHEKLFLRQFFGRRLPTDRQL